MTVNIIDVNTDWDFKKFILSILKALPWQNISVSAGEGDDTVDISFIIDKLDDISFSIIQDGIELGDYIVYLPAEQYRKIEVS